MTPESAQRKFVYTLLIVVAAGTVAGRILTVRSNPTPTFGSNDRSRWATIRALVDDGTYAIGHRQPSQINEKNPHGDAGIVSENGWDTIDKILDPESQIFYSSKPPLFPTVLAGEYWLIKNVTGLGITDSAATVMKLMLFSVNWLPLVLYWLCMSRLIDAIGTTDWGRYFVMFAACFATFVTPFSVTLNNHTVAAWSVLFSVYACYSTLASEQSANMWRLAIAGFFAGLAACVELPAAAFAGLLTVLLLYRKPAATLAWFVPAFLVPIAALLLTNYLALGRLSLAYADFGGPAYEYPGSHWAAESGQQGIDWAWQRESRPQYAFHLLLGHHGLFSLTPIFVFGLIGAITALRRRTSGWELSLITLVVTAVVIAFYVFVTPTSTHNYGGWTCGPRQLMWLTPLLLISMSPCVDRLAATRAGRSFGYVLLAISTLSVSYPPVNPWRHPWIYDFMDWNGWLPY